VIGGVGDFCTGGGGGGWAGRKNGSGAPTAGTVGVAGPVPCPSLKGFVLDGVVTFAGTGGGGRGIDTGGLVTITGGAGVGGEATALFCSCRARRLASNRSCSTLASSSSFSSASIRAFWASRLFLSSPSRALRDSSSGSTTGGGGGAGATRATGVGRVGAGGDGEVAGDRIDDRDAGGGGAGFFLFRGVGPRSTLDHRCRCRWSEGGRCNNWCRCRRWRGRQGRLLLNRPTFTR